ncbi:partitioning defective 3 homolog B isoform X6 [Hemicordylus capensis]|uniref:partitioning defective 3 homolog B isoform X6 n=1 Tax=Hemicordylus capensis TaxID=884348 RepID=UPI002302999A|nr:partitioning defective 3 homolog B isoform X6 [Hemicordylus capensis]
MKVTVCFGKTGIVVPCKDGQIRVRDLTHQALQRYLRTKEKDPSYWVNIHHLEYTDGGILDPDDILADVVEDKDKLIAVYEEQDLLPKYEDSNGSLTDGNSPDAFESDVAAQLAAFQPMGGEIEVTPSALKLGTPLLVRRSSDPSLGPPVDLRAGALPANNHVLKTSVSGSTHSSSEDWNLVAHSEVLTSQKTKFVFSGVTRMVEISGEGGPLGIHVVPYFSSLSGRILGLFIRGIEENSRSKRDGLFLENECIVKINDIELADKTFAQAQDIFRQAMKSQNIILEVVPPYNREQYEKSVIASLYSSDNTEHVSKAKAPPPIHPKPMTKGVDLSTVNNLEACVRTVLHPAKSPNLPKVCRKPSSPSLSPLMGFGSKKNSKRIRIDLKKGPEGLGFTVVTRDSSVHGPGPIFVKNILPRGAAIKDGRLQSGDRILEVNGSDITGRTQEELVAMLRSTKQGEIVSLIIARQEETFLPRELKGEPYCAILSLETTEQLTFEIPLNDSGSAGLGVSLKGNKARETGADLGIFIKSIIHGGAAYKDGRLRINDQLIAVNGESLLGKSNHEAMETLRRSMSMEGNIRGMIQLVVLRRLDRQTEVERTEPVVFPKLEFEGNINFAAFPRRNDAAVQCFVAHCPEEQLKEFRTSESGMTGNEVPPPLPPHPSDELLTDYNHSSVADSAAYLPDQHINFRSLTLAKQKESINLKASKSMDLVADESKVSLLTGQKLDGLSDKSSLSGQEAQNSELAHHVNSDLEDPEGKAKKHKKAKEKLKIKEKNKKANLKNKSKIKEKNKKEENEDPDRKTKKKSLGAMLRFGKKKEDKGAKGDQKGNSKHGALKEEDLEKMKEERERIDAKHQELRQKQSRGLLEYSTGPVGPPPDIDDDETDPNYARVNHFREIYPSASAFRPSSPLAAEAFRCDNPPIDRDHLEGLYARVNKPPHQHAPVESDRPAGGTADRIQKLRKEYHQARREGLPFYDEEEGKGRASDYDQHWVSGKGPDGTSHHLQFEGIERQYASLPRHGPVEPMEYLTGLRVTYKERDFPYYQGGQPAVHPSKGSYIHPPDGPRAAEIRYPQYYPPQPVAQHKGPLRQDVPPSPPQGHRVLPYHEMGRTGYHQTSADQNQYRHQDPRQKDPMTAAV